MWQVRGSKDDKRMKSNFSGPLLPKQQRVSGGWRICGTPLFEILCQTSLYKIRQRQINHMCAFLQWILDKKPLYIRHYKLRASEKQTNYKVQYKNQCTEKFWKSCFLIRGFGNEKNFMAITKPNESLIIILNIWEELGSLL